MRDARRNVRVTMQSSQNGWPAAPDPNDLNLTWVTVATRKFRVARPAAPLFRYAIRRWHREVSPLTGGVMDEWSYNYRLIAGTSTLSNHSSGTAVDLDATEFPMGLHRMTLRQRAHVKAIMRACGGQLRWGGSWWTTVDEMHIELAPGTSPASVKRQARRMGLI